MKKLMLTIASLMFVSVMAVNAQVSPDTSSVSGQPPVSDDMSNYARDMEEIQSADVPASLRSTLQGSEYSGWEEGKVYRNSSTNEYLIVVGDEDAKVYRFDANGSRIEDTQSGTNSDGSMNSGSGSTTSPSGTMDDTNSGSTDDAGSTNDAGTLDNSGDTGSGSTETPASPSTPGSTDGSSTDTETGTTGTTGTTGSGSTSGSTGTTGSGTTTDK